MDQKWLLHSNRQQLTLRDGTGSIREHNLVEDTSDYESEHDALIRHNATAKIAHVRQRPFPFGRCSRSGVDLFNNR